MTALRREIQFQAGYDKLAEGKGCHGVNIRWLLHGEQGTVQFLIFTNWLPNSVKYGHIEYPEGWPRDLIGPTAADLGYHWDSPQYKEQDGPRECDCRPSGKCWYDGSGLRAEIPMQLLVQEGGEAVWAYLAQEYESLTNTEYQEGNHA